MSVSPRRNASFAHKLLETYIHVFKHVRGDGCCVVMKFGCCVVMGGAVFDLTTRPRAGREDFRGKVCCRELV